LNKLENMSKEKKRKEKKTKKTKMKKKLVRWPSARAKKEEEEKTLEPNYVQENRTYTNEHTKTSSTIDQMIERFSLVLDYLHAQTYRMILF